MTSILLRLATGGLADSIARALAEAGFVAGDSDPRLAVVSASEAMAQAEVRRWTSFVLEGGSMLVLGGRGPLLPALHLFRHDRRISGSTISSPRVSGFASHVIAPETPAVSGVGYALVTIEGDCVLLGGPRGAGQVAFLGTAAVPVALVVEAVRWLAVTANRA